MLMLEGELMYRACVETGMIQLRFPLGIDEHITHGDNPEQLVLLLLQIEPKQTKSVILIS